MLPERVYSYYISSFLICKVVISYFLMFVQSHKFTAGCFVCFGRSLKGFVQKLACRRMRWQKNLGSRPALLPHGKTGPNRALLLCSGFQIISAFLPDT